MCTMTMKPPAAAPRHTRRRMLIMTHGYPPLQAHGAEIQTQRKAHWWRALGHDVRVIAANPRPSNEIDFGQLEETEEVVDGVPVLRLRLAAPDATQPFEHTFAHPLLYPAIEQEFTRYHPDVVYQVSGYILGTIPLELAALHGIPSVLFATDYWHICSRFTLLRPDQTCCNGPHNAADCAACRITARNFASKFGPQGTNGLWKIAAKAGAVTQSLPLVDPLGVDAFVERERAVHAALQSVSLAIANSQFLAGWLRRAGVPDERILVVRQGIDANECPDLPVPVASQERAGELRVLYLGQITHHKGVDLLIEAAGQLRVQGRRITVHIHGPVTDGTDFLKPVAEFLDGDAIQIGPSLSRSDMMNALGAADVLVVPSRWYENSPNVILEAFSCGVPVVTAGHGGMAELVHHGVNGLLFEPGNAHSLQDSLRHLLDDPALLPRLRTAIHRPYDMHVEMHAEEAALNRLMRV